MSPSKHTFAMQSSGGGYAVCRDGKPLVTPAGAPLVLPTAALAEAIVAEWQAAGEKPKPEKMALTQLAATAIDHVAPVKEAAAKSLAALAESDLLCHRDEDGSALAARQKDMWQPWLDWVEKAHGAKFVIGQGVMPIRQPPATLAAIHKILSGYDAFRFAAVRQAASVLGSLVLALALNDGVASDEEAFAAAELESLFQAEQWGSDPAVEERHKSLRRELASCAQWLRLLD